MELGDRLRLTVLLRVVTAGVRGNDVVVLEGNKEQRRSVVLVEGDLERGVPVQARERQLEKDPVRAGDVVAIIDLPRLLRREGVGEPIVELLRAERGRLVAV